MPSEFTDVIVLIPGITGSVLERNGREVWGTSAESVLRGLFSGGRTVQDLLLEHDDPEADDSGDGVRATRLVNDVHLFPGLWAIDGYTKVATRLRQRLRLSPGANYFELPYDWRRDNRVAARALQRESARWLEQRRVTHHDAKLVLIAHSMGGLVARYFLEVLEGWRDTRSLVSFGTPYRGSLNALDSLVNGVRKAGILDLTELTKSFTSIYQLLPIYPCLDVGNGGLVRLCEADGIPRLDQKELARVRAAEAFHRQIEHAVDANQASVAADTIRYGIRPVIGIDQPTTQTAIRQTNAVQLLRSRNGTDEGGDGTVPRVAATPIEAGEAQAAFAAARHGSLQNTDAVLAHVQGILTTPRDLGQVRAVGAAITVSLDIDGVFATGEPINFAIRPSAVAVPLQVTVEPTDGSTPATSLTLPASDDEWIRRELRPLPSGVYRITITGDPTEVQPASEVFAVA